MIQPADDVVDTAPATVPTTEATASTASRIAFALDTDIGSDVDDILAIATILGSPELDLPLVTTVYGDALLRARMVARTLATAGRTGVSIVPGLQATRSGRSVWWPGHEGALMPELEREIVDEATDAIAELAVHDTVLAIGPLTNVAAAVERPGAAIHRITLMGGDFSSGRIEHNIRCDAAAAAVVFGSGVQVDAVGIDLTERVRLAAAEITEIEESGPLGRLLSAEMRQFWQFRQESHNVPHDAIAVLMLARPDLFDLARGRVTVVASGEDEGATIFEPHPDGPHRVVVDMDADAVAREILARILRAARTTATPSLNEETQR